MRKGRILRSLAAITSIAALGGCMSAQQVKASKPDYEVTSRGEQKQIAQCTLQGLMDQRGPWGSDASSLVPLIVDAPGPSTVSGIDQQVFNWEFRFTQIDADTTRIELRTRKPVIMPRDTLWSAAVTCIKPKG